MHLRDFLRATSKAQRHEVATSAGTSVAYLYQLAGGHRRNPGANIALGIENATRKLHEKNPSIPVVTVASLAQGAPIKVGAGETASH